MKKGIYCTVLAIVLTAAVFVLPLVNPGVSSGNVEPGNMEKSPVVITEKDGKPSGTPEIDAPKSDETVTFIIETDGISLCGTAASAKNKYENVTALIRSRDIRQYADMIKKNQAVVKASVRRMVPSANLDNCYTYNTVINGFSVTAPYSSLSKLQGISGVKSVTLASSRKIRVSDIDDEEGTDDQTADGESTDDETYTTPDEGESINEETDNAPADGESTDDETDNAPADGEDAAEKTDEPDIIQPVNKSDYSSPRGTATKIDSAYSAGLTGKGRLAVVIDDGFSCRHEAFSASPVKKKYSDSDVDSLLSAVRFNIAENDSPFISNKIAFAYDYADRDHDLKNPGSDHGTGMASVLAGNNGKTGTNSYISGAYDCQLALMKVCHDGETGISDDVILAALDDAVKLSPDVISLSLGVPRISTAADLFTRVFTAAYDNGSFITAAAGNNAININTDGKTGISPEYTDYGTVSYPSTLPFVTSVGSSENYEHFGYYLSVNDKERIEYRDVVTTDGKKDHPFSDLSDDTPYVYTDCCGRQEELWQCDPGKKIIIVKRGETTIEEKIKAANTVNAAGIIIISDEPLYIRLSASKKNIPAAVIGSAAAEYFAKHREGTLSAVNELCRFSSENGGEVSFFSSSGVSSELRLKPDILAPGTENYAAASDGYSSFTGSSSSCAQTAAAAAMLSEYAAKYEKKDTQQAVNALMMNNADRILCGKGVYASPRRQGAGVLDLEKSLTAGAYVTSPDGSAAISMGDSETGEFSFGMLIKSISDKEQTYRISAVTQTDKLEKNGRGYINTLVPESLTKYTSLTCTTDEKPVKEITISPGESVSVEVEMKLSPAAFLYCISRSPNGFYLDGFITLTSVDGSDVLSVPLTGYCGDWELADIFDASVYDSKDDIVIGGTSLMAAAAMGNYYPGVTLGKNATTGELYSDKLCIGKDTVRNAFDMSSAGVSFVIPNFYLLRDADDFTVTITDSNEKTVFTRNIDIISSFTMGGYEPYAELLRSFNSDGLKNIFASMKEGNYTYSVSASAVSANSSESRRQSVSYKIVVDNTPPSRPSTKTYSDGKRVYLEVDSTDKNGIQGFVLYTAFLSGGSYTYSDKLDDLISGSYIDADSYSLVDIKQTQTGATYTYDITNLYTQLTRVNNYTSTKKIGNIAETKLAVRAIDYAYNLSQAVAADSTVSGKYVYHFRDQNDNPVQGVSIMIDGTEKTSDASGDIVFEHMIPDYYGVVLTDLPEDYKTDFRCGAILTDIGNTGYEKTVTLEFTGKEPSEEESSDASSKPEVSKKPDAGKSDAQKQSSKPEAKAEVDHFKNDDSIFALVFVSVLLIITISSLAISRKKRGKPVSLKKPVRKKGNGGK